MKSLVVASALVFAGIVLGGCNDSSTTSSATEATSTSNAAPTSTGTATLSWQAPTIDTNGQALTDLSGYVIYYGTSESSLNQSIQLNSTGTQTYVIDNLESGTWYFAVRAMASSGAESALSNVVSKTIT